MNKSTQVLKAVTATKKVATKKVAKALTQKQKDAKAAKAAKAKAAKAAKAKEAKETKAKAAKAKAAKKRALNPQFATLQSAKRKVENLEYKKDLKKILIEVKRTTTLNNVDTKSLENLVLQNQCKVAINYLLKNETKYLPLLKQVVRTSKSGLYSPYFAEQTIQKIVKMKLNDGQSFEHSLRDLKK